MYGTSVLRIARISSVRYYKNVSTKKLLEFLADMPKVNTKRITEAQQQRQTISKKSEKYGASTVYLQVLGSGARGVPNTLYLFTDQKRYLFNCGECTQRLAHEHKVKLSRLEHIFITSKSWKNIGGLPGLSLTLQDVGVPKITLHGPNGLDELYNATKRFVIMKEMQVTMAPSSPTNDYEDSVMDVKYVHLTPQVSLLPDPKPCKRARLESEVPIPVYDQFTHDDTDYYTRGKPSEDAKERKSRHARTPDRSDKKKTENLNLNLDNNCSVAYICTLKKRLGTLDLAKCVEKGVPPGPLLGQLKSGLDVVLPDGTLVLSKDVKTPDDPGPVFIVLELPDISYLSEVDFAAHFDNGTNPAENIPAVIAHLSPPEVFHHQSYQSFMSKFGPTTRHLVLNEQNSCLGSEAVHRTQHKLHLLDPEVFPLLKDPSIPAEWSTNPPIPRTNSPVKLKVFEDLKNRIAMAQFQKIIDAESPAKGDSVLKPDPLSKLEVYSSRTLTMFHLRPKRQIDRSMEPKLHIQDYYQETMDVDGFATSLEKFHALVHDMRYAKNPLAKEYPKVVFLGTGSCIPSKTRNTSGIVVHVDDQTTILLDCGEGTFGQLVRFYGPRKVDEMLRTLKAIYISHLHADHHIGLIGVLQARAAAFADVPDKNLPVLLMAPGQIVTWLTMYDQRFEKIDCEYTLIPNQSLMENAKDSEMTSAALARIGLDEVRTCLVPHCPNAFGVAITAAQHKITYSGDSLPAQSLVNIGQNSTILIHEATMEDELADEARVKMHSTTSQAIQIGTQMNAKYTILTHFSQRYARLPRLNAHILNNNDTVGIAFDNMQITLSDLPLLPHMYAPLQLMFAEHCVDMELKAATRVKRRERRSSSNSSRASGATWNCRARKGSTSRSRCSSVCSSGTRSLTRNSRKGSENSSKASSPSRPRRGKTGEINNSKPIEVERDTDVSKVSTVSHCVTRNGSEDGSTAVSPTRTYKVETNRKSVAKAGDAVVVSTTLGHPAYRLQQKNEKKSVNYISNEISRDGDLPDRATPSRPSRTKATRFNRNTHTLNYVTNEISQDGKKPPIHSAPTSRLSRTSATRLYKETHASKLRAQLSTTNNSINSSCLKKSPTPSSRKIGSQSSQSSRVNFNTPLGSNFFTSRRASPRTASPQPSSPRNESPRPSLSRNGSPLNASPRPSSSRNGSPRSISPRPSSFKNDSPRSASPRPSSSRNGSPRSTSPLPSSSRAASPRPVSSRTASPRAASPQSRTPWGSAEDQSRRPQSSSDLSKRAQEFLQAVSNPSGIPVSSRTKSIVYDIKRRENRLKELERLSCVSKMIDKNGYGVPFFEASTMKLAIETDPMPIFNSTTESVQRLSTSVIPNFDVNRNVAAKAPVRSNIVKQRYSPGVKSNIPLPTNGLTSPVGMTRPINTTHNTLSRRACVLPSADTEASCSSAGLSRPGNATMAAGCSKSIANGAFSPTKSFTPKLEDIQSSYLLLNEQQNDVKTDDADIAAIDNASEKDNELLFAAVRKFVRCSVESTLNQYKDDCIGPLIRPKVLERGAIDETRKLLVKAKIRSKHASGDIKLEGYFPEKPDPLNEGIRRMMLQTARRNFQTKQYWFRSKYEKIEGLNWITWTQ